ncbi:Hsp20/alpha crystallin family protein [Kitasatospora sp. NPDC052896]|uniref:Hsp20/alpha crystallin family protein n=1 Tax=Kitasatospora sp. NPDC052896 TaxID=3364061 RepID=UPI0037CA7ED6
MAGDLLRRFPLTPHWPTLAEWFENMEFRMPSDEHMIRIEESQEEGMYQVRAELPGIDPDRDVNITVEDGVLTIHAERSEEKKEGNRSEFRYGSFTRSVQLPAGASEAEITATYDRGVLTVKAPMSKMEKPSRKIEITHGS